MSTADWSPADRSIWAATLPAARRGAGSTTPAISALLHSGQERHRRQGLPSMARWADGLPRPAGIALRGRHKPAERDEVDGQVRRLLASRPRRAVPQPGALQRQQGTGRLATTGLRRFGLARLPRGARPLVAIGTQRDAALMETRYPVLRIEGLPSRTITADGSFRVVFDRVLSGYPTLKVKGGRGAVVTIKGNNAGRRGAGRRRNVLRVPLHDRNRAGLHGRTEERQDARGDRQRRR